MIHRHPSVVFVLLFTLAFAGLGAAPSAADEPALPEGLFDAFQARHVGPVGNRVSAVAGVAGDPNVYYVGAASGGIFKTTDGGASWRPIFDDQPVASIGALAVAASDPNVVWAGTGETNIRSNISLGNGIYKSEDAGKTWQHMGLDATGRIGRVVVHPTNPEIVYAAAMGDCYGPQPERGLFRTKDGGKSWEKVLFVDENTGASDLVMDPNNPRILFAGMWQMELNTWSRRSGGPGSGLWTSRDGGDHWTQLEGSGLPEAPWGKIGLAMSAADSRRVYALIETNSNRDFAPVEKTQGVLWRSDDGGESWQVTSHDNNLVQRPLYYTRAVAAPDDADEVHFLAVQQRRSLDGGKTSEPYSSGGDHHDMWIDPVDPRRMIVGHDQGISISTTRGESWFRPQLPIAQMYHVAVDNQVPYFLYGNRQDGTSMRGPSNTLSFGQIPIGAWRSVGGCETGFAVPDWQNPDIVWTGCYDGILDRYDHSNQQSRNVSVWPTAIESWPAEDLRYRFQWTFPIAMSPHDSKRVYVGSQFVHRTVDEGQSWQVISPDLTSNDPELQRRTGGLTLDDAGPTLAPTLFALAESRLEEGLIWAGTNDGKVQLTRDGGGSWTDVTERLPDLPERGTVSNVEPSRHEAGTAYLTVDRHQLGDTEPYVYRTRDYGKTWKRIDDTVPRSTHSYAHCVREDPVRPGLLYLGTENAVYVSFDDGGQWHAFDAGLPPAPVHWLEIQDHFQDLVVGTYGRGFWIVDDLTPLQTLSAEVLEQPIALLPPRPAYRFRWRDRAMAQPGDPVAGTNPDYGASIHYRLAEEAEDGVEIRILDGEGTVVRTLEDLPTAAGLHRVQWDLEGEPTTRPKLRTKPEENPHVRIPDKGWRRLSDGGRLSLLVPPGTYRLELHHGEESWTQPLTVLKDPHSTGSEEDIRQQYELLKKLYDDVDRSARLINQMEWARKQLVDLAARRLRSEEGEDDAEVASAEGEAPDTTGEDEANEAEAADGAEENAEPTLTEQAETLAEELAAIEGLYFDLRLTGAGQDSLRWKRLLYSRLTFLAWGIASSDHPPTQQQAEVYEMLHAQVEEAHQAYDDLRQGALADFNERLREAEHPFVWLEGVE